MSLLSQFFIDPCILRSPSLERRREVRFQGASLWRASISLWSTLWTPGWPRSGYLPCRPLIRYMGHILNNCSFIPFSKGVDELKPFEHCVLLKQVLNSLGIKRCKLSFQQDMDMTLFRSSRDFHADSIAQNWAGKVFDCFKGDFTITKLSLLNKSKEKVSFQASGPFAEFLHISLLGISNMHKEDNIQAIVSTPRPSLARGKGGHRST